MVFMDSNSLYLAGCMHLKVVARTEAIVTGDPLDPSTMMGAQVSMSQHDRIVDYINIGVAEGAKVLTGGSVNDVTDGGYHLKNRQTID